MTAQACAMSSATPAALSLAMSMMTTSARLRSAMTRAAVMPTLPAPPTTVTLRFIRVAFEVSGRGQPVGSAALPHGRPPSHVGNDGVGELRRLELGRAFHLARQVVGHLLLGDGLLEALDDQVRRLVPAEILE